MNYKDIYEKINLIIKNSNLVDDASISFTGAVVLMSRFYEGTFYKYIPLSVFESLSVDHIIKQTDKYFERLIDYYDQEGMLYV